MTNKTYQQLINKAHNNSINSKSEIIFADSIHRIIGFVSDNNKLGVLVERIDLSTQEKTSYVAVKEFIVNNTIVVNEVKPAETTSKVDIPVESDILKKDVEKPASTTKTPTKKTSPKKTSK